MQKYSGVILLFSVVLAITILSLLFNKYYFAPQAPIGESAEIQPKTASGIVPVNRIEQMHADVTAAEKTRDLLNGQNKTLNAALSE